MPDLILRPGALRLVLAVNVMMLHYSHLFRAPLYAPIDAASVYGFFFLSGYWVARLWNEKYAHCRAPRLTFWISRAWRIYPLATISTLIAYAVLHRVAGPAWERFGVSLAIAPIREISGQAVNVVLWSLAVELQFYAAAPFLFAHLHRRLLVGALLAVGAGLWIAFALRVRIFGFEFTALSFAVLFVLGALYARHPAHDLARRFALVSLAAVLVLGAATSLPMVRSWLPELTPPFERLAAIAIGLLALPYVAASLMKKSDRLDRALGDLAYPLFLFHLPAWAIVHHGFGGGPVLAVSATVAFALAAYALIDRPSEATRRAFVDGRGQRTAAFINPAARGR